MCCGGPWEVGYCGVFFNWCVNKIRLGLHMIRLHSPFLPFLFLVSFPYCLFLFCFFHRLDQWQSTRVKPSPAEGRFPGQEDADGGRISWIYTSSKTPLLYLPLLWTSLHCNMSSPLNDSSNNWSSFSCKHHVSLDKGTVNTIMVLVSNSF